MSHHGFTPGAGAEWCPLTPPPDVKAGSTRTLPPVRYVRGVDLFLKEGDWGLLPLPIPPLWIVAGDFSAQRYAPPPPPAVLYYPQQIQATQQQQEKKPLPSAPSPSPPSPAAPDYQSQVPEQQQQQKKRLPSPPPPPPPYSSRFSRQTRRPRRLFLSDDASSPQTETPPQRYVPPDPDRRHQHHHSEHVKQKHEQPDGDARRKAFRRERGRTHRIKLMAVQQYQMLWNHAECPAATWPRAVFLYSELLAPPHSELLDFQHSEPLYLQQSEPLDLQQSEPLDLQQSEPLYLQQSEPLYLQQSEPLALQQSEPLDLQQSKPLAPQQSEPQAPQQSPLDLQQSEPQAPQQSPLAPQQSEPQALQQSPLAPQQSPLDLQQSEPQTPQQSPLAPQQSPLDLQQSEPQTPQQSPLDLQQSEPQAPQQSPLAPQQSEPQTPQQSPLDLQQSEPQAPEQSPLDLQQSEPPAPQQSPLDLQQSEPQAPEQSPLDLQQSEPPALQRQSKEAPQQSEHLSLTQLKGALTSGARDKPEKASYSFVTRSSLIDKVSPARERSVDSGTHGLSPSKALPLQDLRITDEPPEQPVQGKSVGDGDDSLQKEQPENLVLLRAEELWQQYAGKDPSCAVMTEPRVCKFLADIGVFTFKPKLLLAWTFNATEGRVFPKEGFLGGIRRLGCDATIEALRARCSTLEDEAARAADDEDDDFRSFYRFVFRLLTRGQHDDVFRTPKVSKVVALEAWEAILPLRFVHLLPDWKAFLGNLPADLCFNESDWEQFLACRYPKSTRGYLQSVSLGVVDDFIVDLRKARVRAVIERIEKLAFFGDM